MGGESKGPAVIDANSGFGPDNLPYCVFELGGEASIGVRLGDRVISLRALVENGQLPGECGAGNLNPLMAAGKRRWDEVRATLQGMIESEDSVTETASHSIAEITLLLPFDVADYVDFYSSEQHAINLGRMFRPDAEPLLPNWKHLPVGYHGRAGTLVLSGTEIRRPAGQRKEADGSIGFGPSQRLDIELELGYVLGGDSSMGTPVPIGSASDHLFGFFLVNDWSARDIQAWEYVPLGPFLGKSFATSISPWVVPTPALEPFRMNQPVQEPTPLPYLQDDGTWGLDIDFEIGLQSRTMEVPDIVSRTNFKDMYWSPVQQIAHMTINGASVRTGDVCASGTISGSKPGTFGSMIELSWNGEEPIHLSDGSTRTFLEDGDTAILRGLASNGTAMVGFGDVSGVIVP